MTGPKHCGCAIHRDMHGDCAPACEAYGCLPAMRPVPLPDLCTALGEPDVSAFRVSAPVLDAEMRRLYRGGIAAPGPTFHELAPHPKTVRAAALMAAANMLAGSAGAHPHASTVEGWEARVLRTAQRFERYINGTTEEGENPQ